MPFFIRFVFMSSPYKFLLAVYLSFFFSCQTTHHQETTVKPVPTTTAEKTSSSQGASSSPNSCRISGTIQLIDTIRQSTDTSSPCYKAPCRALVKLSEVSGCGPGVI